MSVFHVYGVTIDSALKPYVSADDKTAEHMDVMIRYGEIPSHLFAALPQQSPYVQGDAQNHLLFIPGIARFAVLDGHSILIAPEHGVDEASLRAFVFGPCMRVLLCQRGMRVWPGTVVQKKQRAISFLAPSGFGKSTLAYLLMQRGYSILSDAYCVLDDAYQVHAGFGHIALWESIARQLAVDIQGLERVRPVLDKYMLPIPLGDRQLPLQRMIILDYHKQKQMELRPLEPLLPSVKMDKLYCPRWDYGMSELGYLLTQVLDALLHALDEETIDAST